MRIYAASIQAVKVGAQGSGLVSHDVIHFQSKGEGEAVKYAKRRAREKWLPEDVYIDHHAVVSPVPNSLLDEAGWTRKT